MTFAEGLTCTANGQSCFYEGEKCPNGIVKLNYCECGPDGHGGLTFSCHVLACDPTEPDSGAD